jgi:replication factor C large subunit
MPLLVDKYRPATLSEIIGNEDVVAEVKEWADKWANGERQTPIMLYGSPGSGKTSIAHALARDMGWELLETNASDVRNKGSLEAVVGRAATESTLSGSLRLIVIDEVDGINGQKDRGAVPTIIAAIEKSGQPIILIANDAKAQKLKALRGAADFMEIKPIDPLSLTAHLKRIALSENITVSDAALREIAERSRGDVRSAITDLLSPASFRDRGMGLDTALGNMFMADDFETARRSMWDVDEDPEHKMLWIDENIPRQYTRPEDIHRAFEAMSRADVMVGRIRRRQHWGFMRYIGELSTAGVASAKAGIYKRRDSYQFPLYLIKMSRTVASRAIMKNLCRKIGTVMRMPGKDVQRQIHLIAPFAAQDPGQFRLEESEVRMLQSFVGR